MCGKHFVCMVALLVAGIALVGSFLAAFIYVLNRHGLSVLPMWLSAWVLVLGLTYYWREVGAKFDGIPARTSQHRDFCAWFKDFCHKFCAWFSLGGAVVVGTILAGVVIVLPVNYDRVD
jgi:hypothetical protein